MSIEQIKYFYYIAKYKNITKVAKDLHISQPALSQQLQKFENSLGYKLLERSNKGTELTEMGKIVFYYSERIVDIYSKMLDELNYKTTNYETIRIDACCSIDEYLITKVLCDPNINMNIKNNIRYKLFSQPPERIIENLRNGVCDIGFMCENFVDRDFHCKEISKIEFILFSSPSYNIPKEIELSDLSKYPFITMNESYEFRVRLIKNLTMLGYDIKKLNIIVELGSFESIKKAVSSSIGIAFLPDIAMKDDLSHGRYKKINIRCPKIIQSFNMIYKRMPENDYLNKFAKYLYNRMLMPGE